MHTTFLSKLSETFKEVYCDVNNSFLVPACFWSRGVGAGPARRAGRCGVGAGCPSVLVAANREHGIGAFASWTWGWGSRGPGRWCECRSSLLGAGSGFPSVAPALLPLTPPPREPVILEPRVPVSRGLTGGTVF